MSRSGTPHRLWRMPAILALLTMFGLLAALLGSGAWQLAAWLALAIPIVVMGWHLRGQARHH